MSLRARLPAPWARVQRWYAGHSRRDQRIILGVVAFAALCLLYLWAWVPVRDYRQRVVEEIAEGQEQLARSSRFLGSADSLRAERESLKKRLAQARGRLLPGRGGTLGAAALQERANSLASEKGITVQSTQVMKEEVMEPYRKVSVRLTLSGTLEPFAELVSGLEYGQQLAIPFVEVNRRGAVAGAKGPRTLSATVEASGFVLAEDAKAEEGAPAEGEGAEAGAAADEGAAQKPGGPPVTTATGQGAYGGTTSTTTAGASPTTAAGAGVTTSTSVQAATAAATTGPAPTLPRIVPKTPPAPAPPGAEGKGDGD